MVKARKGALFCCLLPLGFMVTMVNLINPPPAIFRSNTHYHWDYALLQRLSSEQRLGCVCDVNVVRKQIDAMSTSITALNRKARRASQEGRGWLEPTARIGLFSKAFTYILVGGIGIAAVFRAVPVMGLREALTLFLSHRSGAFLLPLIGLGLWAYALWKFLQAICDPEQRGTQWKAILLRFGFLGNACAHLALGWTAFQLVFGSTGGHGELEKDWTARLLLHPWGEYIAGLIAAGIAAGGFYQFTRAWKCKFQKRWKRSKEAREAKQWACYMGQMGLAARGTIFLLIAWLLFQAALHSNGAEAGGVRDALRMLASLKHGDWFLAGVSFGLVAYGLFALIEAHYLRIYGDASCPPK